MEPSNLVNLTDSATKHDAEKIKMELLPPLALEEIAKVLTAGSKKYEPWNWTKGFKWSRLVGSTLRHLMDWSRGVDKDPETGISHLAHAACNLLFLIHFEVTKTGLDDRHKVTGANKNDK